ncbi:MAG: hypothetical protein IJV41_11420 [Oscillospiraceae bacterium]|nr:hypothetical protein [Oscillospiraceae bacterium]
MKMKRWICVAAMLVLLLALPVQAHAETQTQTVALPVEIAVKGAGSETKDRFTVELSALAEGEPLPDGGEDGAYRVSRTGAGTMKLELDFPAWGVYSYKLRQVKGDSDRYTYDTAEYTVTVYVTADGTTTVLENGGGGKRAAASFTNIYVARPVRIDPPRTGDDAQLAVWFALMLVSAAGCCAILLLRKKR